MMAARKTHQIAHDLNNVLATILGTTDLLHLRLKKNDPAQQDVDEIRKACERGAALTRELAKAPPVRKKKRT